MTVVNLARMVAMHVKWAAAGASGKKYLLPTIYVKNCVYEWVVMSEFHHLNVLPSTLPKTNAYGLAALQTKKKCLYKLKEVSICTYIGQTHNNLMLGMRESPDGPLPAHASYSLTLKLRRKG
jgi:hypothetical protein